MSSLKIQSNIQKSQNQTKKDMINEINSQYLQENFGFMEKENIEPHQPEANREKVSSKSTQNMISNQNTPQNLSTIPQIFPVQKTRIRKVKKFTTPIFITKTFQILSNQEYKAIISWNQQGNNFIIYNVQRFQQQILPTHFRHRNFTSFVRQLNMYDFHKIRNDSNINIFEHKEFKRDHKNCLINIKRKGYNAKRGQGMSQNGDNVENMEDNVDNDNISISDHDEFFQENQEIAIIDKPNSINEQKQPQTVESIGKINQSQPLENNQIQSEKVISNTSINYNCNYVSLKQIEKIQKIQQFLSSFANTIQSQNQIKLRIKQLKKNEHYLCLHNKKDIRKLITILRKRLVKKQRQCNEIDNFFNEQDLQELSIEEQIMADKIQIYDDNFFNLQVSLAILSTEKVLGGKNRSRNIISSLNFMQEGGHLFYHNIY